MRKMRLCLVAMVALIGLGLQSAIADTEVSGNITSDTTWTVAGSPYIVVGTVAVLDVATLTIEPGVTVKFNDGLSLNIGGELIARGTVTDSIIFTSNNTTPHPGDWRSIEFFHTSVDAVLDSVGNYVSGCILEYCRIEYGEHIACGSASPFINHNTITKNSAGDGGGIYCYLSSLTITDNTITGNYAGGGGGIYCYLSSPAITDNTIVGNYASYGSGIRCGMNSCPTINYNNLVNEGEYEIYLSNDGNDIDATNNWWGTKDRDSIDAKIWDYYDNANLGKIFYFPILTAPMSAPLNIKSITDIPNDEGGQVGVSWNAIKYDTPPVTWITHYSIWRSLPNGKLATLHTNQARKVSPAEVGPNFNGPAYRVTKDGGKTFYWEWIGNQQAHYLAHYSYTAETFFDSSSTTPGWHYFLVSAHTSDPFIFWDSQPDSGYSVDNLAPSAPQGLMAASGDTSINLIWNTIPEEDFRYYAIYRGAESGFTPDSSNLLGATIDTAYSDIEVFNDTTYYYRVSAFDFAGNEGGYSDEVSCKFTGIYSRRDVELPMNFSLSQNYPNPFNPVTEIRYSLPAVSGQLSAVKLEVYNILGEKVATLVDEKQTPGYKTVTWNAKDVGSGIYFYRLKAGSFVETRRMVVIK